LAEATLERMPSLVARSTLALTDERLRRYRFTAAAEVPYTTEIFLGTDGYGVLRVDPATLEIERLPFGVPSDGVAAVESAGGGVWVGSGARGGRGWLAYVAEDLQRYDYEEGPPATGFRFDVVFDLVVRGDALWAATDRGLWRIVPGGQSRRIAASVIGEGQRVYALAVGPTGIWVATERGLVVVDEREGDARAVDASVREPLYAVAALGDAIWVGGDRGIGVLPAGGETIRVPADVADGPLLAGPVVALAVVGDTLVAAVTDRIVWRDPDGHWTIERPLGEVGEISSLYAEARGVWVAGTRGLAWFGLADRAYRFLSVPGDLPGPIRRIAATAEHLWVGTDAGLVRLRKDVVVP
jgi:ligand-binding sensor domain-containing protein